MKSISQNLPDTFNIKAYGKTFSIRSLVYPDDMPLIFKWMHAEHVIEQWQLHLPMPQLKAYFEKALADDHHRLYIIECDNTPIAYAEIYEASRDRLSRYYKAKSTDMGWHILIGNTKVLGKGYLRPIAVMLTQFIFESTEARKIVGEPDSNVEVYSWMADSLAYKLQRFINMPEKKAALYFCNRDDFYNSIGYKALYSSKKVLAD